MIVSEIFSVIDATIFDSMSSDTLANYYYNPTDGTSLSFDSDGFVLTGGNGNLFFMMGTTSSGITSDLDRFKGNRLQFEVEAVSVTGNWGLDLYEYGASGWNQRKFGDLVSTTGKQIVTLDNVVSDSCTRIYLRVKVGASSNTVKVKNFTVYPV